jgi:hypothetical protein
MKKLIVETLLQKIGSADCGPVAVQIILNFFGTQKTTRELKKGMHYDKMGTSIYENGLRLTAENLKVTLITANPIVFPKELQGKLKSQNMLLTHLEDFAQKRPKKKQQTEQFKALIRAGAKISIEIPTFEQIKSAIDKKRLVLALLYGRALGDKEGGFHFVVVSGYKKDAVFINNPLPGSRSGWFPISDFMYALYASTCADMDNGSLLI